MRPWAIWAAASLCGCSATTPKEARIAQAAWPGEAVRMVMGHAVVLDPFEGLLVHAGLETQGQLPPRDRPLDREGATRC